MFINKVAMTGHASGIGKAIHNILTSKYNVVGMDLQNGYDIAVPDKIINNTLDCQVFINNAYSGNYQSQLARIWQEKHWNNKHFIINIGSILATSYAPVPTTDKMFRYWEDKQSLAKIHWSINYSDSVCKSILINPGFVSTRPTTDHPELKTVVNALQENRSMINPLDVAKTVSTAISMIQDNCFISVIEIYNRRFSPSYVGQIV